MNRDDSNSSKTPTLADVAQHAGVSTATVSRCLNAPDRVVEKTRDRVMTAVKQLGYSPNFGARALAAKRTNTIGAIIPTMENAIFARGLQAFQEELRRHGVTLLVASSSYRADLEEEQIRTLVARGADGLLLIGHHRSPDIYRFLTQQGVPVLAAWVYDRSSDVISVGFDNRLAMRELTEKIISFGHRHIGTISADQASNDRARERVQGIREAMASANLPGHNLTLLETSYGIDEGADAFKTMMSTANPPTIIMCGNDVLAVGAIRQAKEMGLTVPDDISITGFDDIELAKVATPTLTTVHVPHRQMGTEAARTLVRMVQGAKSVESQCQQTTLCLRQSLGSPRGG